MPENPPLLSAIVISYNTSAMTLDCLRALSKDIEAIPSEIIVIDNASGDDSAAAIAREFPAVRLIVNAVNNGFGAANNQGMNAARGDFLLLINSDAFPKPGAIPAMVEFLRSNPRAGVVGPGLLNADGTLQRSCFKYPSPAYAWRENLWISAMTPRHWKSSDYRAWPHDTEREVDFVIGACLMIRRQVLEQVGGFDEEFFMYCEEADLQKRIGQAGWRIFFTPASQVTHLGGASGAAEKSRVNRNFFESLDYYQLKHHGVGGLILFRGAMVIGCSLRAIAWLVVMVLPSRRVGAAAKLKLRLWLVGRQLTNWHILGRRNSVSKTKLPGATAPGNVPGGIISSETKIAKTSGNSDAAITGTKAGASVK